jgi:GNAT superfamily N-acetyltransferase
MERPCWFEEKTGARARRPKRRRAHRRSGFVKPQPVDRGGDLRHYGRMNPISPATVTLTEPTIEIQPAERDQIGAVRDLVRAAYAKWVPLIGREPLPMTADYEQAMREHAIDILYADRRMVGLIETITHADHLWIENVAIAPESQGRGFGRRLLAHAEAKALAAGRAELRLLTNALFEANVALYLAIGYVVDRREPFRGGFTVYMSKQLGR